MLSKARISDISSDVAYQIVAIRRRKSMPDCNSTLMQLEGDDDDHSHDQADHVLT